VDAFLSDLFKNNPTIRTVDDDVSATWDAARNAYSTIQQSRAGEAIGEAIEDVEAECGGSPTCGLPPP
jgi:hypothetical protein